MTAPDQQPRWRALEIGPGGVPADQVRVVHANPVPAQPVAGARGVAGAPGARGESGGWPQAVSSGPSAVFGSFEADGDGRRRPSRRVGWGLLVVVVVVGALIAASLRSSDPGQNSSSGDLGPGACLSSAGGQSVIPVDCSAADAEFEITARYPDSTNSARCSAVSSDVVLVTRDDAVLCLNYRAVVGDCLYAGAAREVGKAACRTPGSTSTPTGLFRVLAVLNGTLDVGNCPSGTLESLVHIPSNEVVCLGMP
jgi:hypothetical protein